jgi:2-keto-4-pentenoate hydratase/2-oxohepta-3-ene-1,7-dioic acid hydratase in catechol pathway/regulator of RNase E activity RraA
MSGHPLGLSPTKIVAVHNNYASRATERGDRPPVPSYFLKPPSTLSRDGAELIRPQGCDRMIFEGEIAVVIGTRAYRISPDEALRYVAGYTAANDAGVLDLREVDRGSNLRSKGQDGFTPLGSTLLHADPDELVLRSYVNGELRQDTAGDRLLFPFAQLVADLARTMTLEPGDVILTGTPAGSGVVRPGDVVEVEVSAGPDRTVRVRNRIVEAEQPLAPYGVLPGPATRNTPLGPETERLLRRVGTATLSSQLRARGIDHHAIGGLRPSRPELRLVGFARTLRYLPLREDVLARLGGADNAQKRCVDTLQPGEVLVIDCRQDHDAGTIGDILALAAIQRGAVGIVTDGGLRDSAVVKALDIPVYSATAHPAVLGHRHVPVDIDLPVACGGALVLPGDVLVGDADGVVVIPRELVDEVAAGAAGQEREEEFIAERVRAGEPLAGLFPMNAARRAEYEQWGKETS